MSGKKIMLVDDDLDILDLLEYNLIKEGYQVKKVDYPEKAVDKAILFAPDLIVLDVMMPAIDGIELCRNIRMLDQFRHTHILFLSAISNAETRKRAFENGGNDFLEKTFELKVLTKKINFILKDKVKINKQKQVVKSGTVTLLRSSYSVIVNNREVTLTDIEFDLLYLMAQNSKMTFSHKTLIEALWGGEIFMSDHDLAKHINIIQRKVSPAVIVSNSNGYSFNGRI